MAKKKLQNDVLFGEQDIITLGPSASSSADSPATESSVDDAALRLLQTQEKLLSNYDLMQQKMDVSEKQIARLTKELQEYKDHQETFVKVVQQDYTFRFDISPESLAWRTQRRNQCFQERDTQVYLCRTHSFEACLW